MKIIREIQNVIDGPYIIRKEKDEKKPENTVTESFVGGESRVVRKLIDLGLALPQNDGAQSKKRG